MAHGLGKCLTEDGDMVEHKFCHSGQFRSFEHDNPGFLRRKCENAAPQLELHIETVVRYPISKKNVTQTRNFTNSGGHSCCYAP
jgi:hypothetical protein